MAPQTRKWGITLPAIPGANGPEASPRAIPSKGKYAFVRCDWNDLSGDFGVHQRETNTSFDPSTDEFYICNGRINELWNSLFTHIRNETVRQRYPEDMPGTFLEMHHEDAAQLGVTSGDVVNISGAGDRAFKGVAIVQEPIAGQATQALPRGMVFAYFSYPVNAVSGGAANGPFAGRVFEANGSVSHDGYVNNVSSVYVDDINPIAALKFARGCNYKVGRTLSRNPP